MDSRRFGCFASHADPPDGYWLGESAFLRQGFLLCSWPLAAINPP